MSAKPISCSTYTVVTIVFGAEQTLLELQARSLAEWLDPDLVSEILVINNNGSHQFTGRTRNSLLRAYGPLSEYVRFIVADDIAPGLRIPGWRSQQVLKLLVAQHVVTDRYLLLDAKNHLVGPIGRPQLEAPDGRAHCGKHAYLDHPLRSSLERTLIYLGTTPADHLISFPPTATPFVMDTASVCALIDEIENTTGRTFAVEFERAHLLEFFLYSGWLLTRREWARYYDSETLEAPTVWPRKATTDGVEDAITQAVSVQAAFFAVHRTALARMDRSARDRLTAYWASRQLFDDEHEAARFIRRFKRRYLRGMLAKKIRERKVVRSSSAPHTAAPP